MNGATTLFDQDFLTDAANAKAYHQAEALGKKHSLSELRRIGRKRTEGRRPGPTRTEAPGSTVFTFGKHTIRTALDMRTARRVLSVADQSAQAGRCPIKAVREEYDVPKRLLAFLFDQAEISYDRAEVFARPKRYASESKRATRL